MLRKPPIDLKDYPDEIVQMEEQLLGASITCSRLDKFVNVVADASLRDFADCKINDGTFKVELRRLKIVFCKKGQSEGRRMAFASLTDEEGDSSSDVVIFPD